MVLLLLQLLIIVIVIVLIVLWGYYYPYPSPIILSFLPPRKRWPETQIRSWLKIGKIQRSYLDYFYRDPERTPPLGNGILAPADGLVTSAELRDGLRYLVIALSFWDMHIQRSPVSGMVIKVETIGKDFMDGEGREFAFLREKPCPVQKRVIISTDSGEIAVRLITSLAARRIEVWVRDGEIVVRGQRIGRILLGSTVVLELPVILNLSVFVGQRVTAGKTVVAHRMTTV